MLKILRNRNVSILTISFHEKNQRVFPKNSTKSDCFNFDLFISQENSANFTFCSLLLAPSDFDISPKDELVFLKGPKGLMATISLTKNAYKNMAFKIKTTTPERYRVRPSIGLIEDNSGTVKIEVYYQPVNPDSDDNTDILKDKFLVMLFFDVSSSDWRNQVKERKPSNQHRMRASIKKSTLKSTETSRKDTSPVATPVDKDKDVYLKAVRIYFTHFTYNT